MLDDSGPDHGSGTGHEPKRHPLDWSKVDTHATETGVDNAIANWDEDDEGKRIEVGEDIVGQTMRGHGSGLGRQVVVQLVVGEPVDGEPAEDGAGLETTLDFVNPLVIEGNPGRALALDKLAGLGTFPEIRSSHVLVELNGVEGPATLHGLPPDAEGLPEDGTGGRRQDVAVATPVEHEWRRGEQDGGECVREPETDKLFSVGHANLADQSTDVDEEVEVL